MPLRHSHCVCCRVQVNWTTRNMCVPRPLRFHWKKFSPKPVELVLDGTKLASVKWRACNKQRVWLFLARGIQVPQVLRVGRQRVSPLVMAINSPYLEEETRESPGILETLLLGNCDPNEFGSPEVSPMTAALRIMDTEALVSLLTANANPNRTPRGVFRSLWPYHDRMFQ